MFSKLTLLFIALLLASASAVKLFKTGAKKAAAAPAAAKPGKFAPKSSVTNLSLKNAFIPEGAVVTKFGAWGGRPDATPEMQAPEDGLGAFLKATWRYNKPKN